MKKLLIPVLIVRAILACALVAGCATTVDDAPGSGTGGKGDGASAAWGVNDVSILFPLPQRDAEREHFLWLVPRAGERGPAVPPRAFDRLPPLNADVPGQLGYAAAMVTSLRFDPCAPRLGGSVCQAQLRLIAQPVITSANGMMMLEDAAAHLFYTLSPSAANAVVAKLGAIREASPVSTSGPLRVHPGLVADLHGTVGELVRTLVTDHCTEASLSRITVNTFAFDNWGFAKFDRAGDDFVRQPLVGMVVPGDSQTWIREAFVNSLDDPSGTIEPASAAGFSYLLSAASFTNGRPRDPSAASAAAARVLAIENPELTSTEDTDCASCHLATQARLFAARHGVAFEGPTRFRPPAGVDDALVLAPELAGNLGATIAFGYHKQQDGDGSARHLPSISQRTINESAAIAAHLAAR